MKKERKLDLSRMKKTTRLIIMLIALGVALTSCAHQKADATRTETTASSVISRVSSSESDLTGGIEIPDDTDSSLPVSISTPASDDEKDKPYVSPAVSQPSEPYASDPSIEPIDSSDTLESAINTDDPSITTQNLTSTYTVNASLWSGIFPKTLLFDKGSSIDTEDESSFYFLKDPQNVDWGYIRINITEESETEYRTSLKCYVSLQDYTAGNLPVTTIGGLDFISYTRKNMGKQIALYETIYFYRDEASGMTIRIVVGSNTEESEEVFKNLQFHLPDLGLSDAPFPWEDDPIEAPVKNMELGSYTIEPEQMNFSDRVFTAASSNGIIPIPSTASHAAILGNHLYTMDTGRDIIRIYDIEDNLFKLILEEKVPADKSYSTASSTDSVLNCYTTKDNGIFYSLYAEETDPSHLFSLNSDVAVSPDHSFALAYSYSSLDVRTVEVTAYGEINQSSYFLGFPRSDLHILNMSITDNYIFADTQDSDYNYHNYMFDISGKFIAELTDGEGSYMSTYCFCEYDKVVIAPSIVDNNFHMWTAEGKYVGSISASSLFGLPVRDIDRVLYPALSMIPVGDGVFYVIFSYDNNGVSEDLAFRLTIRPTSKVQTDG